MKPSMPHLMASLLCLVVVATMTLGVQGAVGGKVSVSTPENMACLNDLIRDFAEEARYETDLRTCRNLLAFKKGEYDTMKEDQKVLKEELEVCTQRLYECEVRKGITPSKNTAIEDLMSTGARSVIEREEEQQAIDGMGSKQSHKRSIDGSTTVDACNSMREKAHSRIRGLKLSLERCQEKVLATDEAINTHLDLYELLSQAQGFDRSLTPILCAF